MGNISVRSTPCSSISASRGSGARKPGKHDRVADDLAVRLALGVALAEVLLLRTRAGDDVERRVGDELADRPLDDDLRPPPHLDVVDGTLVAIGQVTGERVLRLVQMVVGIEHREVERARHRRRWYGFSNTSVNARTDPGRDEGDQLVAITNESDVYYDPYDFEIDADPHPIWKRLRDEAPLYYNERYDFFALSRFDDVERALVDWETYRSGKGSILELIKADIEIPPGDHPVRGSRRSTTSHRGLLSARVHARRR